MVDAMKDKELRLLLTRNCNFDCVFCHKEGLHKGVKTEMTHEDYTYLYTACKNKFGWQSISLTGGEPLVYSDFDKLVQDIANQNGKMKKKMYQMNGLRF